MVRVIRPEPGEERGSVLRLAEGSQTRMGRLSPPIRSSRSATSPNPKGWTFY